MLRVVTTLGLAAVSFLVRVYALEEAGLILSNQHSGERSRPTVLAGARLAVKLQ